MAFRFSKRTICYLGLWIVPTALLLWAVVYIHNDVITADYWRFIGLVEAQKQGTLALDQMLGAVNGPFKSLLIPSVILLNGSFFDLQLIQIQYWAIGFLFMVAGFLIRDIRAQNGPTNPWQWMAFSLLIFGWLGANKINLLTHGQASLSLIRLSLYALAFLFVARIFGRNPARGDEISAGLSLFAAIFLYGHSAMPAFLLTLFSALPIQWWQARKQQMALGKKVWIIHGLTLLWTVAYLTLFFRPGRPESNWDTIWEDPVGAAIFFLKLLGMSVCGNYGSELHPAVVTLVGCIICIWFGYVVVRHFTTPTGHWLAYFSCLYTGLVCALILIARFGELKPEQAARYFGDTSFWLLSLHLLVRSQENFGAQMRHLRSRAVLGFMLLISLGQIGSYLYFWQHSKYIQRYYERIRQTMTSKDPMDPDFGDKVLAPPYLKPKLPQLIQFLKDNHLNVYRTPPAP